MKMEEKKLTDKEIIQALDCGCLAVVFGEHCEKCVLHDIESCNIVPDAIVDLIHRLQSENERLKKQVKQGLKDMKLEVGIRDKEIERLTEENELKTAQVGLLTGQVKYLKMCGDNFLADCEKLQKQVDELTEERENMQAEIMRFEDMKFTQEHCDLYKENEWLKASLQQAVKDTAKEILQTIMNIMKKSDCFLAEDVVRILAKQNGVEVE